MKVNSMCTALQPLGQHHWWLCSGCSAVVRFLLVYVGLSHLLLESFSHPPPSPQLGLVDNYNHTVWFLQWRLWDLCLWLKTEFWEHLYHVLGDKWLSTNSKILLKKKSLPLEISYKRLIVHFPRLLLSNISFPLLIILLLQC